ncbi:MAG: hypothetical protein WAK55_17445 [Xanthobacteraceae bacterium]
MMTFLRTKKSTEIRVAFYERFRKAYKEEFGIAPSAQVVYHAWIETAVPPLEQNAPAYESLNVSETALFVKAAVTVAISLESPAAREVWHLDVGSSHPGAVIGQLMTREARLNAQEARLLCEACKRANEEETPGCAKCYQRTGETVAHCQAHEEHD